jgi:DUF4097 and DUF4098 domain-containing protein YvlB
MKYAIPLALSVLLLLLDVSSADSRFERTYTPEHRAHLTLSNVNGNIRVVAWEKRTIVARVTSGSPDSVEDRVNGDEITIATRLNLRPRRIDFDVSVPPETSITIKNIMGEIELRGIAGHVSVTSIGSDVRLTRMNSPSVDVVVTSGDIFFDGELRDGGSYTLQSMRGDLDVTLPSATPFNLNARALSENINLGSFFSNLIGSSRGPKGVSGTHIRGGSRLSLTAYTGRILLHKK